jgi:hypothetical protein
MSHPLPQAGACFRRAGGIPNPDAPIKRMKQLFLRKQDHP